MRNVAAENKLKSMRGKYQQTIWAEQGSDNGSIITPQKQSKLTLTKNKPQERYGQELNQEKYLKQTQT